ncbi:MAG TPA: FeoC-like transcriptional regulator [Spirochaetota bacterium]|nr:FeoC-like transcriptional regulator [Spirochaetota bacterium]HPF04997.1 FeoC-like transcriptional regulator [Spirochaetota bacterium]HPJ42327.1 FeoC-like transcriptional regulator [Spirochaetota bacterium]HPR37111.1 FeoC-like transcriptional regulator [Spirochaetota bacterium]HRX46658.1 FeoC-like transcriptional regulator [Spirochaetota bacterium]
MLLAEIKRLVEKRGEVCASEIYAAVDADRGLVDHALYQLMAKGVIIEVVAEKHCTGCMMNCSVKGEKIYRLA